MRTADGRYAKLEMVGYYCPGARPGCPTFRYVYQGDGTTAVDVPSTRTARAPGPSDATTLPHGLPALPAR